MGKTQLLICSPPSEARQQKRICREIACQTRSTELTSQVLEASAGVHPVVCGCGAVWAGWKACL